MTVKRLMELLAGFDGDYTIAVWEETSRKLVGVRGFYMGISNELVAIAVDTSQEEV